MSERIDGSRRSVLKSSLGVVGAVGAGSLLSRPASAATTTVSGGGDALQNAIDGASDGDTIVVVDSADYSPITVDVGVTIETDASPTIVGDGGITSAVGIDADGVTIRGFRITNDGGLIGVKINPKDGGVGYNDITVENNLIENLGPTEFLGVTGVGVGTGSHDNISILGNTIQDLENEVGERSRFNPTVNGVLLDAKGSGADETISNSEVTNNTIRRLTSDIAALGIVTQQTLDDVAINNNSISGILVDPGTDSDDSDDSDGGEPGYAFGQGINITSPATSGVDVNSNRIEEVTVRNTTNEDVTVFFGESVKIDGDASGATFRANSFFGPVGLNNQNGADGAPTVDARNNYWGSPKGPDTADSNLNADGDDQSEVIGNVRYRPFQRNDSNREGGKSGGSGRGGGGGRGGGNGGGGGRGGGR
ncbi:MAG: hypothetical protein ABEI99_12390 [Halobaculum sp.]